MQIYRREEPKIDEEKYFKCTCGSFEYVKALRCGGWWNQHISGGEIVETDTDQMWYGSEPKTVKCADCGKRHPNPHDET